MRLCWVTEAWTGHTGVGVVGISRRTKNLKAKKAVFRVIGVPGQKASQRRGGAEQRKVVRAHGGSVVPEPRLENAQPVVAQKLTCLTPHLVPS